MSLAAGPTTDRGAGRQNGRVIVRRLGWVAVTAGVLALLATPAVGALVGRPWAAARSAPQVTAYLLLGAVAFGQRPENRAGRRLLGYGVLLAWTNLLAAAYSAYLVGVGRPGWAWVAVLLLQALDFALYAVVFALIVVFPDGRYRSPFERRLVVAVAWTAPVLAAMQLVGSARLTTTAFVWQDRVEAGNPLAVRPLAFLGGFASVAIQAGVLTLLLGVVLLIRRYRSAEPQTRRQIAWPLYALALTACSIVILGASSPALNDLPDWLRYLVFLPVVAFLPVGLGIGIVRHRLLDINLVIRRSVVYAVLWTLITVGYIGLAAVFGFAVGATVPLDLAIVLTIVATLVAAPVRRRLERLADRVAFGKRLSGYQLISQLGAQLEASPAPEQVADLVAAGVRAGLDARWSRVSLDRPRPHPVGAAGIDPTALDPPTLHVPLVHGGEVIGAIDCGPKTEGRYSAADHELLETLGRQAALAIRNSQLSTELSQRLDELEASRTRLVHAEAAGRRRLERDIHDGVQQELVAVLARLGLARNQLRRDRDLAEATLREVQADGRRALESLQELVRGIHPPILTDRGLLDAVRERVARVPLTAEVSSDDLPPDARFGPDVEAAAYFFVSEALGNVLKHAGATRAWVRLRATESRLSVEVRDDGRGFAVEAATMFGLCGLFDRIEALGGQMEITSGAGTGTTVSAWLPTGERVHA
jgi:signal transduction histidine kinase